MDDGNAAVRPTDNVIQPFQIDGPGLRGRLIRLGASVDAVLGRHDYPEPVARLLGETLALAAALSGALKYDGVFSLQTKGDGPIRMMVVDVTSEGALRGYAAVDAGRLAATTATRRRAPLPAPLPRLLPPPHL